MSCRLYFVRSGKSILYENGFRFLEYAIYTCLARLGIHITEDTTVRFCRINISCRVFSTGILAYTLNLYNPLSTKYSGHGCFL